VKEKGAVFDIFMEIMDLYTAALIRLASMLQCTHYVAMGANPDKERKNERIYVDNYWKDQEQQNICTDSFTLRKTKH
jgi:hypothetical protein